MIKPNSFSGWGGEEKDSSERDGIGNEIEFKDVELSADGVFVRD